MNGLKLLIVAASAAAALAVSLGAHADGQQPLLQADSGAGHQGS